MPRREDLPLKWDVMAYLVAATALASSEVAHQKAIPDIFFGQANGKLI